MRFSKVIMGTLVAGSAVALTAYEKARSSFVPQPPQPDFGKVVEWVASGNDMVALGAIALAAISMGYSIYQMFKPDPATRKDVGAIVTAAATETNSRVDEVGGQVFLADQASEERDTIMHSLLAGEIHERAIAAVGAGLWDEAQLARIREAVSQNVGVEGAQKATKSIVEAATRSSDEVQQLLAEGKFAEAGAAQRALAEAGDARQTQLWRDTARILVLTSITKAISAYARAVELDPAHFGTWIELSRLHQAAGSLPEARRTAEAALQHVGGGWDRMIAEEALGDIAVAEGQLPTATRHYQARLATAQAVLAINPHDNSREREVSVSHNKLGDVARAEGDLVGAQQSYAAGLAIAERLAASDLGNAAWQRDFSVSHERLGDVAVDSSDLLGAQQSYAASLAIRERLAASDPGNAAWQRDLLVSHNKLGDFAVAVGDLGGAQQSYAAGLAIAERLAASDPGNAEWQRDLSVSHDRLAQLAEAAGDKAEAIAAFEAAEAILIALIARVADHPGFAGDLAQVRRDIARLRGA